VFKRILQVLMTGLLLVTPVAIATSATQQGVQAATATSAPQVDASAAIAIDPQSGQVLYEKNADQVLPIASMTKMITAYIVLDQIKQGKLKWDQTTKPDAAIIS
jgi:D-alanyl-D-alanine carboxypeptidase (penicillin-binding protein 5/6)